MKIRAFEQTTQEKHLKDLIQHSFKSISNHEDFVSAAFNIAQWYRTVPPDSMDVTDLTENMNSVDNTNNRLISLYKKSAKRKRSFLPLKERPKKTNCSINETIDLTVESMSESKENNEADPTDPTVPTSKLSDIVGIRPVLIKIGCFLYRFLHGNEARQGLLLYGPGGCGKTLLAHSISGQLGIPLFECSASDLMGNQSERKIRSVIEKTKKSACVLLFDQIGVPLLHSEPFHRVNLTNLLKKTIDDVHNNTTNVLIIATCENLDDVDESLRAHGRLQSCFQLGIPSETDRFELLKKLCSNLNCDDGLDLRYVSSLCPGYTGGDLKVFVDAVISHVENIQYLGGDYADADSDRMEEQFRKILERLDNPDLKSEDAVLPLRTEHFEHCIRQFKTCVQTKRYGEIPRVKWSDVGALDDVKEELQLNFLAPIKYKNRIKVSSGGGDGILLVGPPGCGKTMLAKALANEAGLNFFGVSGPELINKYVGESERAIRELFCEARSRAPSVIFFDEIDGICPSRHGVEDGAHSSRFVSQMLTELNGLNDRAQVYILAATNRPDRVDPAIRRHGRIGITIFVGIPTVEDRFVILNAITKSGTEPEMADDVDFRELSRDERLENFTGADLQALVDKAVRVALKQIIMYDPDGKSPVYITKSHFNAALEEGIKPSLTPKLMNLYCRKMNNL